jgi:hypothetical protein
MEVDRPTLLRGIDRNEGAPRRILSRPVMTIFISEGEARNGEEYDGVQEPSSPNQEIF